MLFYYSNHWAIGP